MVLAVNDFQFYFSGETPYASMAQSSIVSQIISDYRLPTPEYASEEMWVLYDTVPMYMVLQYIQL